MEFLGLGMAALSWLAIPLILRQIACPLKLGAGAICYGLAYFSARFYGSNPEYSWLLLVIALLGLLVLWVQTRIDSFGGAHIFWQAGLIALGLFTAFLSGPQGGAGKLMHFLLDTLRLDQHTAENINLIFRKTVHVTVYGLLAAWPVAMLVRKEANQRVLAFAGFGWAIPHALLDEWNQSHFSSRTGSYWDVALDIFGMSIFLLVLVFKQRKTHE